MGMRDSKQTAERFQWRYDEDNEIRRETATARFSRPGRQGGESESWEWYVPIPLQR